MIFAELDADQNMSISQTLNTVVGETCTLSFWYSTRPSTSVETNGIAYSVGNVSGIVNGQANSTPDNIWQVFMVNFVAHDPQTVLTLSAAGISDGLGSSLDNVSITPAVAGCFAPRSRR